MFEREHHRRIATLLESLDAQVLLDHACLFGGGTAVALSHGEYRESVDVDFVCSSVAGYRGLRERVGQSGMAWAFIRALPLRREPRVDQYGIRCAVDVGGLPVKLEIVFEARVDLAAPRERDRICGVWTMTAVDLTATKLMANADRWADDAVMSRDLIDLAMLAGQDGSLSAEAAAKSRKAYGSSIDLAFAEARQHLLDRPQRLKTCMRALGMTMRETALRRRIVRLDLPAA